MTGTTWAGRETTFESFDPNKQFEDKPLWGVFDGARFKTYAQRGHALNGMSHHYQCKLYEQTPTGWVLRAVRDGDNEPEVCEVCGQSTVGPRFRYDFASNTEVPIPNTSENTGSYHFRRRGGKLVSPIENIFTCSGCVRSVVN